MTAVESGDLGETSYGIGLLPQHAALLAASAIPPEVAQARQYRSVTEKARLEAFGFTEAQRRVPGLLVPLHDGAGRSVGVQYRPDQPRERDGRPVKYETPPKQPNRLDVPPGVGVRLGDPTVPLWITEGARKADAAAAVGLACVSLSGVWNWRGSNGQGGKTALPDWHDVALNGRTVVLAFDSDSRTNDKVRAALEALAAYLRGKGATVRACELPDGTAGKTGLDDFLAAGHDRVDLERLVVDLPEAAPARSPRGPSAATALVDLAHRRFRLGVSTDDEPFGVPLTGPPVVRPLRGGKASLRAALAAAYYAETGQVAPQQALAEAVQTLEGQAQDLDAEPLHLRVAEHGGALWLDLGDPTGRAVRITGADWQVVDEPPVLFRRTALTGALPDPERGGTLDELWRLLNVAPADRPLVLAWMLAALLPDVPHPVLALRGEQGTGKSTCSRTLAALLDPSPAQTRKPPRDGESWVTAAAGSWVVALDNVSTVAEWWSDALCRAVTGDGDVRRRLYSDADLTVWSFRRVVLLNGIDLGAVRDDLAERLLTVELHRIGERGRRLDADLAAAWSEAHPRVLGALLDLAVQVLAELPRVKLDRMPRMADFGRLLAAVDHVVGTEALRTYVAQAGELAADAVDSDPMLAAIVRQITAEWSGTAAQLLDLLAVEHEQRPPRSWPKDPRALTAALRRRGPALRRLGWTVDDLGRGGRDKQLRWQITPPTADAADRGDRRASGGHQGGHAGIDARLGGPMPASMPATGHPSWPATTPETAGEAGIAGIKPPSLPLLESKERQEHPTDVAPVRVVGDPMPATPAMPAECVTCGQALLLQRPGRDTCERCRLSKVAS